MASTFALKRGIDEFLICRRPVDAGPTAMRFEERTATINFLRSCLTDPVAEQKLRLWILADPRPSLTLGDEEDLLEHLARRLTSGHMAIAKVNASAEGTGIIRPEGSSPAKSKKAGKKEETTPLQDEMARQESAMAEEEEVVLEEEKEESEKSKKTWIEIELVDPSGLPASGERYKLTLPDGSIKWGRLDRHGKARIERLQPGNCQVTFPDRDEEVWEVQ